MPVEVIASTHPTLKEPNLFQRMPRPARKVLEYVFLVLTLGFIGCQLYIVRRSVLESILADNPPVRFEGDFIPDKEEYQPGEIIRFTYVRIANFSRDLGALLVLSVDSFENVENGEIYAGSIMGRVIPGPGRIDRKAVRVIPEEISPGTYIFEGWMQAQTSRRSLPVSYKSIPFRVIPKKLEPTVITK